MTRFQFRRNGAAIAMAALVLCAWGCDGNDAQPSDVAPAGTTVPADAKLTGPLDPSETVNVGILVLEGVYNSELAAPYDIFQHTVFHIRPAMKVFTVGRKKGLATSFEGLRIGVDYRLEDSPRIDVLVVPSAERNLDTDLDDQRLIEWVRRTGGAAHFLVSACDGAFVLAKAGLLDGLTCTTFPADIEIFRELFPHLEVLDGPTWVADGKAFTGVGGALSYDPALALVAHIYGDEVAAKVAPGLVLEWEERKAKGASMHGVR